MGAFGFAIVFLALTSAAIAGDDAEFFESTIRPLLAANCQACHTGNGLGGLRLDSRVKHPEGRGFGKVVVEGKPDESLLMQAVRRTHIRLKMPPVVPWPKRK